MSKKSIMSRLLTAALAAFTALPMLTVSAYAEEGSSGEGGGLIREVSVELDASGFKYGSAPVMIASVPDGAHYSVLFERWSGRGRIPRIRRRYGTRMRAFIRRMIREFRHLKRESSTATTFRCRRRTGTPLLIPTR